MHLLKGHLLHFNNSYLQVIKFLEFQIIINITLTIFALNPLFQTELYPYKDFFKNIYDGFLVPR